jgi:TPR repeat protein
MAERGRIREAAPLIDQAARLDPGLAVVHEGRGLLAWRQDKRDEARAAFARAAELQSTSAVTHYLHGTLLLEGPEDPKGLEAAAAAFQRAVELNHDSAPAYAMLAQTLARTGAPPEQTLPLARRAVGLEPTVASHHFVVARILLDAGRIDEAEKEIGRALGVARDDGERDYGRRLLDFASRRKADLARPEPERSRAAAVEDLDPASAAKYMEKECGRGDVRACAGYGAVLLRGDGVERNEAAAVPPLQRACDAGNAPSCASLGWLHHTGKGTPQNDSTAAALFAKACAAGGREACLLEANAYSEGRGVPRDVERARRTFEKACEDGLPGGCSGVGVLELRRGTGANFRRAAELFTRACEDGDGAGCANLAEMQAAGVGMAKDAAASARSFRKACDAGYQAACSRAGVH